MEFNIWNNKTAAVKCWNCCTYSGACTSKDQSAAYWGMPQFDPDNIVRFFVNSWKHGFPIGASLRMHLSKSVSSPDCGPLQLDKPDEMKAFVGNTWKIILAASARHIWLECTKLLFLQQGSSNRKSYVNKKSKGIYFK